MKAVVLADFGGVDSFELREVPVPEVGPRQVRVRVCATAVNPLDFQIRRGDYPDLVPLPAVIGHDISGVIEEVGSHVVEFRVGDEVVALVERGLVRPVIGAILPLARMREAHEILENRQSYVLHGKVAIDVVGSTVSLPPRRT